MTDYIPGVTECIHLKYPNPNGKIGTKPVRLFAGSPVDTTISGGMWDIACTPGSEMPKYATPETEAVTCPLCKESGIFEKIKAEQSSTVGKSAADQAVARMLEAKTKQQTDKIQAQIPATV